MKGFYYIVAAVLVGLVAAFSIHRVISTQTAAPVDPIAKVVVADADITAGTPLSARLVKMVDWPQRLVPAQAVQNISQIEGRVLIMPLAKGEPILLTKLAPEGTAAGLGGLLQKDMRAYTIKVDDVSGVAGFIHPGDRVDILMTVAMPHSGEQFSKVVLQDIKVLTAGQVWQQAGSGDPKSVNTVTLEVTPEQSEVLNLASAQGRIHLSLRNRTNKDVSPTAGIATSGLIHGKSPKNNPPAPQKAPQVPQKRNVEVIKGMEKSESAM
jgi:pilus assembly protein CpaB